MCGRFVSAAPPDELARYFGAQDIDSVLEPSFNVAPTDEVYAVRSKRAEPEGASADEAYHRALARLRWGLVPFWAKDRKVGSRMINARSESVLEKSAFKRSFEQRRCLIPADGFYEWAKLGDQETEENTKQKKKQPKQPYFIHRSDSEPMVFAGLWAKWKPRDENGEVDETATTLETFTILTCEPNREMAAIHNRMPVLLAPQAWDDWLWPDTESAELLALLQPAPDDMLTLRPVSTAVNRVANNLPELLDQVEPLESNQAAESEPLDSASLDSPSLDLLWADQQ